jgi:hypothetical protein
LIRKYATTEQVEYRGHWVGKKGHSICARSYHVGTDDPYTDSFVASLLCQGGPVAYQLKEVIIVTDDWIFEHVVPNIQTRYRHDN